MRKHICANVASIQSNMGGLQIHLDLIISTENTYPNYTGHSKRNKMMKNHPTCSGHISINFHFSITVHLDTLIEFNNVVFFC